MHNKNTLIGYTLIELMVTLAIASILVGLATPSLQTMISNSRLTSSTNEFLGALSFARSEAVKRGMQVTVLRKSGTAGVWEEGWDIFVDANADNTFVFDDAARCQPGQDCLLRSHDALPNGYTLGATGNGDDYRTRATYMPSGLADSALGLGATFTLCDGSHDDNQSRQIVINTMGRPMVKVGTGDCTP